MHGWILLLLQAIQEPSPHEGANTNREGEGVSGGPTIFYGFLDFIHNMVGLFSFYETFRTPCPTVASLLCVPTKVQFTSHITNHMGYTIWVGGTNT